MLRRCVSLLIRLSGANAEICRAFAEKTAENRLFSANDE